MGGYIGWRPVDKGNKKPDKVPTDTITKEAINHLDPDNWRTPEQIKAAGLYLGIVFTEDDPYFFLDLDNCYHNKKWDDGVLKIVALFPNAIVEVSFSNNGLHIYGRCDADKIGERKKKFILHGINCEFYTKKRFAAVGETIRLEQFTGEFTQVLMDNVPRYDNTNTTPASVHDASRGPVPEYTGPAADDVIIKMMLGRQEKSSAIFGDKATIADLWNKNTDKLRIAYPTTTPGQPFNHSGADAALMAHLAFWTGRDYHRMERIFGMSKLGERKKWTDTPGYRKLTIDHAVGRAEKVYDKPRKLELDEVLSVADQKDYFKGCVYVARSKAIMIPKGELFSQDQFRVWYGGHQFLIAKHGGKNTYNAWEAFTENRAYEFPKVRRTRFLPGVPHGEIVDDGVNVYYPHPIPATEGDISPFLDLLVKMLPQEHDREILLGWMASIVQNPGVKFLWSPVLQGTKGNGKGFVAECLIMAVGEEYCWDVKPEKIGAKFNTFLENRLLINVTEMNMFAKRDMIDALKSYITDKRQEVEGKGSNSVMISDYCANWLFATNEKDGVIKDRDDRRFCVFFTAHQRVEDLERDGMLGDYFTKLWAWAKNGGYAIVRDYLLKYVIAFERDPAKDCFRAPESTTTQEAIIASLSPAAQHVLEAIELGEVGFRGGWISSYFVGKILDNMHRLSTGTKAIASIVGSLGYIRHGRCPTTLMQEGNNRPILYCKPSCKTDYMVAQGYRRAGAAVVVPIKPVL